MAAKEVKQHIAWIKRECKIRGLPAPILKLTGSGHIQINFGNDTIYLPSTPSSPTWRKKHRSKLKRVFSAV